MQIWWIFFLANKPVHPEKLTFWTWKYPPFWKGKSSPQPNLHFWGFPPVHVFFLGGWYACENSLKILPFPRHPWGTGYLKSGPKLKLARPRSDTAGYNICPGRGWRSVIFAGFGVGLATNFGGLPMVENIGKHRKGPFLLGNCDGVELMEISSNGCFPGMEKLEFLRSRILFGGVMVAGVLER